MSDWNAQQYLRFVRERTQPSVDLIHRLTVSDPARIIDVGCGPGNSTAELARYFPSARITGIDNSADMIAQARKEYPGLEFRQADILRQEYEPESFDIVFSNAVLQWLPGHAELIPRLFRMVRPGGALACQIPMNHDEPSHRRIRELADTDRWRERFEQMRIFYNLTPEEYYDLFSRLTPRFQIWQTTYYHPMESHEDIIEWLRGTGLRPYLTRLTGQQWQEFDAELLARYRADYPAQENGRVLLRFPRFFFVLQK